MAAEQVAEGPVPAKVQVPLGVKVTVPVGVVGPVAVSVTVAVQLVAWLTTTVDGVQPRVVEVVWRDVVPSDITLTSLLPSFATKTSPFPLSYATPPGPPPTGTVATTVFVTSEITLTVLPRRFVTKTSPVPLSYATPVGPGPTGTVATTGLVTSDVETTEWQRNSAA